MSETQTPTWKEFENALSWFGAAPARWLRSAKSDMAAVAQWIWEVIQGDFNEEQTTAQAVTSTAISMIPFVDQICDVRDLVANCKKINQDSSNKWAWVALVLTLIGLFPTVGSLFKGSFKILFAYGRKAMFGAGKAAFDGDVWKLSAPYVESGIKKLNEFLARPAVRKTLEGMKLDNVYKSMAEQTRVLSKQLSTAQLTQAFDLALGNLKSLLDWVQKWGTAAMKSQAGDLYRMVKVIRDQANAKLAEVLKPVQDWLDKLARRLDKEADANYQAAVGRLNIHTFTRPTLNAEIAALKKSLPQGAKIGKQGDFPAARNPPKVPKGHFDIGKVADNRAAGSFDTFHGAIKPDVLPPGTVLYRVLDPNSVDNSICWMTEKEFKALKNKLDWRERFAVWKNWNANGEYLTYTVPRGKLPGMDKEGLPVWRGTTASQQLKDNSGNVVKADAAGNGYWLKGGHEQIVVNPAQLSRSAASARQATGWGLGDADVNIGFIGVPSLQSNWK